MPDSPWGKKWNGDPPPDDLYPQVLRQEAGHWLVTGPAEALLFERRSELSRGLNILTQEETCELHQACNQTYQRLVQELGPPIDWAGRDPTLIATVVRIWGMGVPGAGQRVLHHCIDFRVIYLTQENM